MMASLVLLIAAKFMTSCASRLNFNPFIVPQPGRMMQQHPMSPNRFNSMQVQTRSDPIWLSNEQEASGAWLAKLDDPSWGAVAAAVRTVPSDVGHAAGDEDEATKADMIMWTKTARALVDIAPIEEAKAARPAKMDGPMWDAVAAAVLEVALGGSLARLQEVSMAQQAITNFAKNDKDAAMDALFGGDDAAKKAWLARMDAPTWGAVAEAVSAVASVVNAAGGDNNAAKKSWLERVDAPTWAKAAPAINTIAQEKAKDAGLAKIAEATEADMIMWTKAARALVDIARREEAKAARPAMMDGPSWDAVAAAVLEVALGGTLKRNNKVAAAQRAIVDFAKKHKNAAVDELLGDDDAAKEAWLARMDAPTWGALAEAVSAVATIVNTAGGDDDAAKKSWLERVDAPTWARAAPAINTIALEEKAKDAWLAKIAEAISPVVAAGALAPGATAAFEGDTGAGEQIFSGKCATCFAGGQKIIQSEETPKLSSRSEEAAEIKLVTHDKNAMPPFSLSEEDIKNVATYVISLADEDWD